jgi:hypothetical protein
MIDLKLAICDTYAEQQDMPHDTGRPWSNPYDPDLQILEDRYPELRSYLCELQGWRDQRDRQVVKAEYDAVVEAQEDAERDLADLRDEVEGAIVSLQFALDEAPEDDNNKRAVCYEDGILNALEKLREAQKGY